MLLWSLVSKDHGDLYPIAVVLPMCENHQCSLVNYNCIVRILDIFIRTINTLKNNWIFQEPCAQWQDKSLRFYIPEILPKMKIACFYFLSPSIREATLWLKIAYHIMRDTYILLENGLCLTYNYALKGLLTLILVEYLETEKWKVRLHFLMRNMMTVT